MTQTHKFLLQSVGVHPAVQLQPYLFLIEGGGQQQLEIKSICVMEMEGIAM